jgi:hypothetical protein
MSKPRYRPFNSPGRRILKKSLNSQVISAIMSVFNAENKTLIDNLRSSLSSRKSGIGQAYLRVISLALEIVFQRGKMPLFDVSRDEIDKIEKFSISVGLFYTNLS